MDKSLQKFEYGAQTGTGFFCLIFFLPSTIYAGFIASKNEKSLSLYHIITLSPEQADIFYWILFIGSSIFVLLGFWYQCASFFGSKKYVEITANSLTIPNILTNSFKTIPFSDVILVTRGKMHHIDTIVIRTRRGDMMLLSTNFKRMSDFESLDIFLRQKISR